MLFMLVWMITFCYNTNFYKEFLIFLHRWKEVQEDGKSQVKWDGNGKKKSLEQEKESWEIIDKLMLLEIFILLFYYW